MKPLKMKLKKNNLIIESKQILELIVGDKIIIYLPEK